MTDWNEQVRQIDQEIAQHQAAIADHVAKTKQIEATKTNYFAKLNATLPLGEQISRLQYRIADLQRLRAMAEGLAAKASITAMALRGQL